MMGKKCALVALTVLVTSVQSLGKLWGDLKPKSYKEGDKLDIHVGRLWSAVAAPLPYDFYSLNWCESTAGHKYDGGYNRMFKMEYGHNDDANLNLHESPYTYEIGHGRGHVAVCKKMLNSTDQKHFVDMIYERYRYQLFLDNLPNSLIMHNPDSGRAEVNYREGILVGDHTIDQGFIINNHLHFTIKVHHVHGGDEVRIVGFEVQPYSIAQGSSLDHQTLHLQPHQKLANVDKTLTDISDGVIFSYSWSTVKDRSTTWAHRFDQYFEVGKYDVHVKQILISTGIMLFVSITAFGYVKVSVTRDFALLAGGDRRARGTHSALRQHDTESSARFTGGLEIESDAAEQVGWQRIRDDIFRAPAEPTLLALATGVGAQITLGAFVFIVELTIFQAMPSARHIIFYVSIAFLAVCGYLNGFIAARTMKFFQIHDFKMAAIISAMVFPGYIFTTLSSADIIESLLGTAAAVPFSEGLWHYLLWWALDAPCATLGAYHGFKKPLGLEPEVGPIKRSIPPMPWYLTRPAIAGLYGPLIFATIAFEFNYLMDSLWRSYMIYAMFGILFISLMMMTVTIASLSIVVTYKLLCHQNYDWWWSSFSLGASGGLYMLAFSAVWMFLYEDMSFIGSDLVYFFTMAMISACFSFMCGSISVLSSYLFVERIYRSTSKGQFTKF